MFVEKVRIESLANDSYVVGSEQSGRCIVIDPARDVDQYVQIAANHGTRIVYAFETHVHNDFVSGARELADQTGCQVGASASGGLLFPSVRLQEDDEFDLGDFKVKIIHTPGHTPESVSFLIEEQGQPTAIFTGGALMLGGAARVDLLGSKIAPFLARWLHNTIHEKLLKLPDDVLVYPTHGGGSFCSAAAHGGGEIPTTIARERLTNPLCSRGRRDQLRAICAHRSWLLPQLLQVHGRHQPQRPGHPGRRPPPILSDRPVGAKSPGQRSRPD